MWNSRFYHLLSPQQDEDQDDANESRLMSRSPSSLSDRLDSLSAVPFDDTGEQVPTSSSRCVAVPVKLESSTDDDDEEIEDILENKPWPGSWMEGFDDMKSENANEEESTLFEVLESAKKSLPVRRKTRSAKSITVRLSNMPKAVHEDKPEENYDSGMDEAVTRSRDNMDTPDLHSIPVPSQSQGHLTSTLPRARPRKRWGSRRQDTSLLDVNGASASVQAVVKKKKRKKKVVKELERKPIVLPHLQHKYKKPEKDKVKREYRQLWNEKGKLTRKNTEYLEIYYESYLPDEKEDIKLKPTHYTYNHKNGNHWEVRYLTQAEKPEPALTKVDRVFENEYKIFQLNKLLDKQLNMKD